MVILQFGTIFCTCNISYCCFFPLHGCHFFLFLLFSMPFSQCDTNIYLLYELCENIFWVCVPLFWRMKICRKSVMFVCFACLPLWFSFLSTLQEYTETKRVSISFNFRSTQTDYSSLSKYGPLNRCEQEVVRRGQLMPLAL